MKIVWLRRAVDDYAGQLDHIATDDPSAAIDQGDRILHSVGLLADQAMMGRVGRVAGTRELVVPRTPFIVVYRVRTERIELLRVLHGAQRWPPLR